MDDYEGQRGMKAKRVSGPGQPMTRGGYRNPSDGKNETSDPIHDDFRKRTSGGRPSTRQKDFGAGKGSPIAKNEM